MKNEKWKAKVQTPDGVMKLEIEDIGMDKLEIKGKIKKEPEPIKKSISVMVKDYTYIDGNGEVDFKNLEDLTQKITDAFK